MEDTLIIIYYLLRFLAIILLVVILPISILGYGLLLLIDIMANMPAAQIFTGGDTQLTRQMAILTIILLASPFLLIAIFGFLAELLGVENNKTSTTTSGTTTDDDNYATNSHNDRTKTLTQDNSGFDDDYGGSGLNDRHDNSEFDDEFDKILKEIDEEIEDDWRR